MKGAVRKSRSEVLEETKPVARHKVWCLLIILFRLAYVTESRKDERKGKSVGLMK